MTDVVVDQNDGREIPRSIIELVDDLKNVDEEAANRLLIVSNAVYGESAQHLATVNPQLIASSTSIETQAFIKHAKWPKILNVAEWIRNVLVLLPITITWYGLSVAAKNYNSLISRSSEYITEPFLLLWERGFHNPAFAGMKFSHLAIIDFWLLLTIVVITFFVHIWRDLKEVDAESKALQLKRRLDQCIWQLEEKLAKERFRQNTSGQSEELAAAVETFNKQFQVADLMHYDLKRVEQLAESREIQMVSLNQFVENFEAAIGEISAQNQQIGPIYKHLSNITQSSISQMENFASNQNKLTSTVNRLGESTTRMTGSLEQVSANLNRALEKLQTTAAVNNQDKVVLMNAIQQIGQMMKHFSESDNLVRETLHTVLASNNDHMKKIDTLSDRVVALSDQSIVQLKRSADQFTQIATQNQTFVSQLQKQTNQINAIANDFKSAIAEIHRYLDKLGDVPRVNIHPKQSNLMSIILVLALGLNAFVTIVLVVTSIIK
jgi:ABC-type transporter Mla subunit MlaD